MWTRPDHEEPGQPSFATIAGEAERFGLKAVHIPVAGGIGAGQLQSMTSALQKMPGPFLGYCLSGARAGSLYASARRVPA